MFCVYAFHSYINYSSIAARVVRKALKPELRQDAVKRSESAVKITPWKDGKPQGISESKV